MDFTQLEFISSAGLRVLIANLRIASVITAVNLYWPVFQPTILSVFDLAGFTPFLRFMMMFKQRWEHSNASERYENPDLSAGTKVWRKLQNM
jgi:hypothetical protein